MRIKSVDLAYQIREMGIKKEGREIHINWRFKEATHFLVFLYDSRREFVLEEVLREIAESGLTDEDIVHSPQKKVYSGKKDSLKVFCVREKEFVKNGKKFSIMANEAKRGVPCTIAVYVCRYDEEEGGLSVYEPSGRENEVFLPITIEPEIRYKKVGLLPGNKKRMCILRLPYIEEYRDGAIMYHIDGIETDFPLPSGCLGKDIVIMIPVKSEVCIRIREEYRKYYK
ncbi:MAG: hypothetical protein K2G19_00475, partial [Lachnospiraceae bacterium]|nr:hypothetical protein [Lachnospiraceae bacterium]